MSTDPFANHLRLKKPCANCPFRKEGAIELSRGRMQGIISSLVDTDQGTFPCHKTVHSSRGGEWSDEGDYSPSGHEAMCAGAAAYLMKKGRPTLMMRMGFVYGAAQPGDWDEAKAAVID